MLAVWKVIRLKSGILITTPILLESSLFCSGAATTLKDDEKSNWGTTFWDLISRLLVLTHFFPPFQHVLSEKLCLSAHLGCPP